MSINSQILATMEGEGILNEGALPLPDQTFAPSLAVNSGDVIREGQETPLTDSMKQKLLNPTTVFKSLENQVETITTMEEVQKQIATKPAISLADAEQVAMTFEGFTKKISLKEFTSLPTQTGFNTVKQFMTEQIKLRKENISTEAEAYFDGHIADAEQAFEDFSGFYGERLKVELIRSIIISRNSFGVAVNHNCLIPHLPKSKSGMDAAVVKFDSLSDTVGTAAEDHYFFAVTNRNCIRSIIG